MSEQDYQDEGRARGRRTQGDKELVLAPGTYGFIQDRDKGSIRISYRVRAVEPTDSTMRRGGSFRSQIRPTAASTRRT